LTSNDFLGWKQSEITLVQEYAEEMETLARESFNDWTAELGIPKDQNGYRYFIRVDPSETQVEDVTKLTIFGKGGPYYNNSGQHGINLVLHYEIDIQSMISRLDREQAIEWIMMICKQLRLLEGQS